MKKIYIDSPKFGSLEVLIDDDDFLKVSQRHWHVLKQKNIYYVVSNTNRNAKAGHKRTLIKMHRYIMGEPIGKCVDHKDGNGLNNQKCNLRICTQSENVKNAKIRYNSLSGFKGVSVKSGPNKYVVTIHVDKKRIPLGRYNNPVTAAKVYNEAALKYHGEFARLNQINHV